MTIFGNSRLGRVSYAAFLILMICFDFTKAPVEKYIMGLHDQAIRDLASPEIMARKPDANPMINGLRMPLMPKAQMEAFQEIAKPGHKYTEADMDKLRAATQRSVDEMLVSGPATDPEVARLVDARGFYAILHAVAAIAMTAITVVGLLWMVSSRLRDIGAPQYLMLILLAPVFIPKFVAIPLPEPVRIGLTVFFFGVLLILALIPPAGSGPLLRRRPPPAPDIPPTPVSRKSQPVQFGKLGS